MREPRITIELYQNDWMPGFACFSTNGKLAKGAKAHIALNLGACLSAVVDKELKAKELPYVIAESIMHEVIHVLEAWAEVEFSEKKVERLITKYRKHYNP